VRKFWSGVNIGILWMVVVGICADLWLPTQPLPDLHPSLLARAACEARVQEPEMCCAVEVGP
jgi:hypothetical protein